MEARGRRAGAAIEHNRSIPEQLNALVLKLLEKRPEARPKSARAVAEQLQGIASWLSLNAPTIQDDDDLFSRE